MFEPLYVILTTYLRQQEALRTVDKVLANFEYEGDLRWIIVDDGSPEVEDRPYVYPLIEAIETAGHEVIKVYNSERRGVGHGMNVGIRTVLGHEGQVFLMLEDDWELLDLGYDFTPDVDLLLGHEDIGMIRYGYLAAGMSFHLFGRDNRLWFRIEPHQYKFSGHPSLRHVRFHRAYGMYREGLPPGETELSMCAQVNQHPQGPMIITPCYYTQAYGLFGHIGTNSLKNEQPRKE